MVPAKYRRYSTSIIRIGLGLVFLAHSYLAFTSPHHFHGLISESFLAGLLPVNFELFVKMVGISDGTVAALLLIGRGQKYVAIYAFSWLAGVMAVIGIREPADLLEHFGSLSMAAYLMFNRPSNKSRDRKLKAEL